MRTGAFLTGVSALAAVMPLAAELASAAAEESAPPSVAKASAPETMSIRDRVRAVIAAVCSADEPSPSALALSMGGAVELSRAPLRIRDRVMGVHHSLMLPDGARIRLDRIETEGILRRVIASYAEPSPSGRRPVLLAFGDSACNVMGGRRLTYESDGSARSIEFLLNNLERAGRVEPLNPPVPGPVPGERKGPGVRVALVDSGVNYLLPEIGSRLARDEEGALVGYDFWDLDARPLRCQSRTQRIPSAAPRDPHRVADPGGGAGRGARPLPLSAAEHVANGGLDRARGAGRGSHREHGDGEPAPRRMDGIRGGGARRTRRCCSWSPPATKVSTSTRSRFIPRPWHSTTCSRSPRRTIPDCPRAAPTGVGKASTWRCQREQLLVTSFRGGLREVSGSSYAAARVSALAACLLAAHPEWTVPELKAAIVARAREPVSALLAYVGAGTLPDPIVSDRGACDAEPADVTEIPLGVWTAEHLHGDGAVPPHTHAMKLDIVVLGGSGWRIREVHRAVTRAADVLAQCGVAVGRARLRIVEAPRRYRYLDDVWSPQLLKRLDLTHPAVFFVEETLRRPAFEAEAFGQANTRSWPIMRDTVWVTRAATELGVVLAHELFHVLADLGQHDSAPDNLMNEYVDGANTRLHDWQCERMRKVSTAFGMASPVQ